MGLYEVIQKAAGPAWSAGVEMVRSGAVIRERATTEELVFQVVPQGAIRPFEVYLWPEDEDWSCTCRDANRPGAPRACAHVAAAVIATRREADGRPAVSAQTIGRVGYRLRREPDRQRPDAHTLSLERVIRRDSRDLPLKETLNAAAERGHVLLTDTDLAVEELAIRGLYGFRAGKGPVPRELAPQLLSALAGAADVTLDGATVTISAEPVLPRARVEDGEGGGFLLKLVRDRRIDEVFTGGVVRLGQTLHPSSDGGLDADQRATLARGVRYAPEQTSRLVSEAIPRLQAKIPVDIRTSRLPRAGATPPRMLLELSATVDGLAVEPALVYGDPPCARLERGQLRLLGGPVPVRDEAAERRLLERLRMELGLSPGLRVEAQGEEALRLADRIRAYDGASVQGEALSRFQRRGTLRPAMQLEGDRFDLRFQVDGGEADPARVLRAWRQGANAVALNNGGWAALPRDWLERYGSLVADLLDARQRDGSVPKHALFDLGRLTDALDLPPPPTLAGLRALASGFEGLPEAPLPPDLRADLRPYQRIGVNWLAFLRRAQMGGILADDMGLGKTLQALAVLGPGTLVVAPTSVLPNWAAEARKFRPGLSLNLYHGPARRLDPDADLTITSYALLRLDAEALSARRWATVVLDEAQAIKNPDSQVARAAYSLQADLRLTLTGTPVENRLLELWSQMHFLNPGLLGGRADFEDRYADPIASGLPGAASRLRARIRPFVLRRMKAEVARDLPPRTDITLRTPLSDDERAVYDAIRVATRREVVEKLSQGGGVMAALEALLRLRQAACHPALVPGQRSERSSKIDLLIEMLDELRSEGHKALVFSQWTSLLDLIEPHLREAEIPWTRLDGSTRDRGAVVSAFQADDGPPVLLLSLKAGGTGLNLTAADHVFLIDPWWNPAVEEQAADRAHRIGQDRPVMVYRLLAEDTVETRILELQERKRTLADAALGEAGAAASITRDDLLALLA